MQYRPFGRTGEKISALGFGCMRFPELEVGENQWRIDEEKAIPMLRYAFEHGVNYFDTAPYYCHGNSEATVGRALHDVRDRVLLSTKCPMGECRETADFRRSLERSLRGMDVSYIDFYHFWSINRECFDGKIVGLGLLEEARRAKEEGLIRHISFSFHDKPDAIRHIIDTAQARGVPMETMLCQYNLLDRSNEEMMSYAAEKGLGVVAMGPVGGGRLSAPTDLYQKLTGKPAIATYELAFRFVLGHPGLSCALSGMQTLDMVRQNIAVASDGAALTEAEWKQLGESLEQLKKFSELYCTGCAYCQPCPAGIDIPRIFELYTHYNVYGLREHAQRSMRDYVEKGGKTLRDCKNCGFCERKCPQRLEIRRQLKRVETILLPPADAVE